jgi:hypothetical protein
VEAEGLASAKDYLADVIARPDLRKAYLQDLKTSGSQPISSHWMQIARLKDRECVGVLCFIMLYTVVESVDVDQGTLLAGR